MKSFLLGVALVCPLAAGQPPDVGPAPIALSALSMDELIERLPVVGAEEPVSREGREWTYAPETEEMKRRLSASVTLTPEQWERVLTRTGVVRFRPKWPSGERYIVPMQDAAWLGFAQITLSPANPRLLTLHGGTDLREMCGNEAQWRRQEQLSQSLGSLPAGKHHLEFHALMNPGAVSAGVRDSLGVCIRAWGQKGEPQALLVFDADVRAHPELAGTAIDGNVEVLRDGEVKGTARLVVHCYDRVLSGNSVYPGPVQLFSFAMLPEFAAAKATDEAEVARWSLRLSARSEDALRLCHAQTRWASTFEVPLATLLKQERDRMAGHQKRCFVWMP